ncbi:hypothetical protein [Thiohalocapsa marina]|uniref:hypothetical protein n=1 Tax=Thiohalocapsa marina TaxID=424902 RepID=UPI0036DB5A38
MKTFDTSVGLSEKDIGAIKYNIKKQILVQLPELPDLVETQLILQGRTPWQFNWKVMNSKFPIASGDTITIETTAKLKREFHRHGTTTTHTFICKVRTTEDAYRPDLSITRVR